MTTAGGAGTAPVSDGAAGLSMVDVLTEAELDSFSELQSQITDETLWKDSDTDNVDDTHINWGTNAGEVSGADVPIDASGFDGNLDGNDDTVQEVAQKLDDLSAGSFSASDISGQSSDTPAGNDEIVYYNADGSNLKKTTLGEVVSRLTLGMIEGCFGDYKDADEVTFTTGWFEANGEYYTIDSDTDSTVTSLASGDDIHYAYVDDSESTPPTPTIIWSTTEPSWSAAKRGYYNGDDRCIWAVWSSSESSDQVKYSNLENNVALDERIQIASNMSPDGTWQTPNNSESSAVIPVISYRIFIRLQNTDSGATPIVSAVPYELINNEYDGVYITAYAIARITMWLQLGASRNIRIKSQDDDDNEMSCYIQGWEISR
jgi:hypothetical protein